MKKDFTIFGLRIANNFLKVIMLSICLIAISFNYSISDETEEEIIEKLPKLQGISNAGLDFYLTIPPVYEESFGNNFTKFYITSNVETDVTISVDGKGYSRTFKTVANDVISWDLTPNLSQVRQYSFATEKGIPNQTYPKFGVKVTSEHPIVLYVVCKYAYTSDGFLAVPKSGLGTEYVVASYNDLGGQINQMPPIATIVAAYDNTNIEITMGGDEISQILLADGSIINPNDKISNIVLNEGDVFLFTSNGDFQDITGSRIVGDKPFSLISGHYCANVPLTNRWCDYMVEQQLPIDTWGYKYHIPAYNPRRYNGIVRIFASEPNTTVYRDGEFWFSLDATDGTKNDGWVEKRVWDITDSIGLEIRPKNALITSDKPIQIMYYNTGTQEDMGIVNQADSDPFMMNMYPIEQYENEITFCTPGTGGGDMFINNYLNLVYESDINGNVPDDIMFARLVGNDTNIVWEKFSDKFGKVGEKFFSQNQYDNYASKQVKIESAGTYKIKSEYSKLACYSFGFSPYESYGYPTAGAKMNLAVTDLLPPVVDIISTSKNGNVEGSIDDNREGEVKTEGNQTQSKIGSSGLGSIYLDATVSKNYKLQVNNFITGLDKKTNWSLSVVNLSDDAIARVVFVDRNGNDTNLVVTYKGLLNSVENNTFINSNLINNIYPNPISNGITTLNYNLQNDGSTSIKIYDINSILVKIILNNEFRAKGENKIEMNTNGLVNGTYLLEITNNNQIDISKFIINK